MNRSEELPAHVPPHLGREYSFADQPGVAQCPYRANAALHDLPDIFFSPAAYRSSAGWVVSSAEYIREIYNDPARFSSNNATGFLRLLGRDVDLIPVEVDPPLHRLYRATLNRCFTAAELAPMEAALRDQARTLVQDLANRQRFDFVQEYGRPYPVGIFLDMMDFPRTKIREFVHWEEQLLHGESLEEAAAGARSMMAYLEQVIPERAENLGDDLLSKVIASKVGDRPIESEEIFAMAFLLFFGGLDTVAATMSFIFKHLAEHPDDQAMLRAEPELIPGAVEEFLRAYSVVSSPRVVKHDLEFHGVAMKGGDRMLLASTLAGRDPEAYPDPHRVDLRRKNVRHLAFASGPHMCVGAPLARRELRISLEEWLSHDRAFRIAADDAPVARAQGVFDVRRLPLEWGLAER